MERVMIIDWDVRQIREINDGLTGHYQTLSLSRGDKALDLFQVFRPNALVVDPTTPGLRGQDFIRKIRSLPAGSALPILALSQFTTLRHIEESFDWGVNMIYSKPCSGARVKKKLDELFNEDQSRLATV